MQIILVSRHLKAARTIHIMPRHVVAALFVFLALVFSTSLFFSWLSVHFRLPLVEDLLVKLQLQESQKTRSYLDNNLQLMAARLGELQGQVLQLDALGDRVSGLVGVPRERPLEAVKAPQGGPYLPAPFTPYALQDEIDRLAGELERHSDDLLYFESRLLEKRVKERLMPTTLPVKDAVLGSAFGYRADPIAGERAMHEGLDFSAESGTPVVAAADGVVLAASYHPEYGNLVEGRSWAWAEHALCSFVTHGRYARLPGQAGGSPRRGGQYRLVLPGRTCILRCAPLASPRIRPSS